MVCYSKHQLLIWSFVGMRSFDFMTRVEKYRWFTCVQSTPLQWGTKVKVKNLVDFHILPLSEQRCFIVLWWFPWGSIDGWVTLLKLRRVGVLGVATLLLIVRLCHRIHCCTQTRVVDNKPTKDPCVESILYFS